MKAFHAPLTATVFAIGSVVTNMAFAQDYQSAYRSMIEADQKGDLATARAFAIEAYEEAQSSGASPETIARLAQIVVNRLGIHDPAFAVLAAREAQRLGLSGYGMASTTSEQLSFAVSALTVLAGEPSLAEVTQAAEMAEARFGAPAPITVDEYKLTLAVIISLIAQDRADEATRIAAAIAQRLEASDPRPAAFLAEVNFLRARATVDQIGALRNSINDARMREVYRLLNSVIRDSTPQHDIETFDKTFARALAWSAAIHGSLHRYDIDHEDHAYMAYEGEPSDQKRETIIVRDGPCDEFTWIDRELPHYPRSKARRGIGGAVLI